MLGVTGRMFVNADFLLAVIFKGVTMDGKSLVHNNCECPFNGPQTMGPTEFFIIHFTRRLDCYYQGHNNTTAGFHQPTLNYIKKTSMATTWCFWQYIKRGLLKVFSGSSSSA